MKKFATVAISIIVAAVLLYFVFSTISFDEVLDTIRAADKRWIGIFLLCSTTMSIFATWRYLLLLNVLGYTTPKLSMYLVVLVRNLFSDLLPARLGTVVYIFIVRTRLGIPAAEAITSFGYAFLFDFVAMAPLIILAAFFAIGGETLSPDLLIGAGVVLFLLMGTLIALLPYILLRLAVVLKPYMPQRVDQLLEKVSKEVAAVSSAGILGRILTLSFGIRIAKYFGLYAFLVALLVPRGYTVAELPFPKMFIGMSAAELSATLPISGIAGLGTYQGTWIAVFSMLGFPLDLAKVTAISHHLFSQGYGYSLGLLALLILMVPWMKLETPLTLTKHSTVRGFMGKLSLLIGLFVLVLQFLWPKDTVSEAVQVMGEVNRSEALNTDERVVFDSRRGKSFGIFEIAGKEIQTIVDAPNRDEVFPAYSPDGQSIVFADAKGAGRYAESEIKIWSRKDKVISTVAVDGTFPSVSSDGKAIFFERDRKKIIKVALDTKVETELFPGNTAEQWGKFEVVKPRVSPDQKKVTFTSDKGGRWHVWVSELDTGKLINVADGCEPSFIDEDNLVFVKTKNAKAGSGIFRVNLANNKTELLQDQDGVLGHEYFPTLKNGRLLFSATSEDQHNHETGDYQLFLLDIVAKKTYRLTNDNTGSRWSSFVKLQ